MITKLRNQPYAPQWEQEEREKRGEKNEPSAYIKDHTFLD
jgi:hypothetical protein